MKKSYLSALGFKRSLIVFLCFFTGFQLSGQTVTNYTFATSTGTFTALTSPVNPTLSAGDIDDGSYNNIPIGFDFWYMGTKYTAISASTNGYFSFGTSVTDDLNNNLSGGGVPRPVIAPLWDDLDVQVATNVSYKLTGSAPNRVFAIQYLNTQWQYNATGNTISFQALLYETTGKIEFIYRPEAGAQATPTASIGITAAATGSGNFLSVNNAGTSVSSTVEASVTTKPVSGKTYAFTPPVPTAPGSLTFSGIGSSSMTLNWSDLSSNETGFVVYKSTDGGTTYNFESQTAAGATSSVQSGLTASTTYYWKIYAVSEGGLSTALSGNQATTAPALTWYNGSWLYRKAITIDYTKVSAGAHTNFPVLISITDAGLQAGAQADYDDILFTSSDGSTKLDHEVESYTSGTGALVAWVEVPSLSSSANTVIYMYYGNAAATAQQNITGTWDGTFKAVHHLNNAFLDATSNNNDGTNTGTTNVAGKIANGSGFVRSNGSDYITITGLMGSPTSFTLSAWATLTTADPSGAEIISLGDHTALRYDEAGTNKTSGIAQSGAGAWNTTASGVNHAGTGWHYVSFTFDDAGNSQKVYVDGVQVATSANAASPYYTGAGTNTFIGKHGNANVAFDFDGTIDEVRVSNAARSAGWVLTEYNNQNSPSTFYSVGSVETAGKTFTGTGNFSTAARWTGGTLPVAGENLIIDGACTVDNSGTTDNVAYGTLTIGTATGRTLNWAASGTNRLNVTNVSAGAGASTLDMTNGGTLIIKGTFTSANLTLTRGTGTIEVQSAITLPAAYTAYTNLTINSAGTVTLGVNNTVVNGSLNVTTGTLQLGTLNLTSGDLQGAGTIASSGGTPTLTVGSLNTSTTFSGVIGTGAIAFTKNGTGVLTLSGTNTYTGLTTITAGTLKLGSTTALGTTAGATSVTSGAVLDLNGINYSNAEVLTLAGTGISSGGCLINSNATAATYAGNITLSITAPTITANNPITLSGVISGGNISGTNSLTVAGNSTLTGALTLSGNNTYTGFTNINSGALLKIGANNALGAAAPNGATDAGDGNSTIINSGGVLDLNGITYTQYEGVRMNGAGFSAAGDGCIINSSATAAIYSGCVDPWSSATLYIANPVTFNGMVQFRYGNSFIKTGNSTLTLSPTGGDRTSANSILIISAGTLKLGVNLTETGSVTAYTRVSSGAVLDLNGFTCARYLYLNGTGISSGGALINNSSTAATHSGSVILESAGSIVGDAGTIAITGTITGAGFGLTLGGSAGGSVTNVISGTSTTLTKNGSGTWNLSALNTYTGTTTASAGILRATNNTIVASTDGAFGNNASGLFLNGGTIQSNVATFSRPITVSATNSGLDGYGSARTISSTINNATGSTSYNLNVGGTTNGVLEGQNLTLSGVITNTPGTLSLTKIGTNTVSFSNQAVTIQNLAINAGTLTSTSATLSVAGNYSNSGTFTHNSGTLNFNGTTVMSGTTLTNTFNQLTVAASSTVTSSTGITGLVVNGTLTTGASALLDLGTTTLLSGTLGTISNTGTIKTSVLTATSALPIPTGKTWGGTIEYAAATGAQTVMAGTYTNLKLSNTSGTNAVSGNITVSGILTFTAGTITTGANSIYLNASGTVSRTSGHVIGNLKKYIATGATSKIFEIGDATNYAPVTVAFASVTTAGDLTSVTIAGDHANIGTSTIIPAKTANRTWTLTNQSIVFTTCDVTFTFVAGDLDGGATTSNFIVGRYSAGWAYPAVGTKTSSSTQATGLSVFGDFQVGEEPCSTPAAPTVTSPVNYCQNATATQLTAIGSNLIWSTGTTSGSVGGTSTLTGNNYIASDVSNNKKTLFTTTANNVTIVSVDYWVDWWMTTASLQLGIFDNAGTLISSSSTITSVSSVGNNTKVTNVFNFNITTAGNYSIGIAAGSGNIAGDNPAFPITEVSGTVNITGISSGVRCFNNIQFTTGGSSTAPTPVTTAVGTINYLVNQTVNGCVSPNATIAVVVSAPPTTSAAGADQTGAATCGLTTVTLAGNAPTIGTGAWSIISGAGGTVTTPTSATSTFTGTAGTTYTLRWTISSGPCTPSTDDVVITFNRNPTTSAAGADQTSAATCGLTTVTLAANAPSVGTGAWSIISGAGGTVTTPTSATSTFNGTAGTTYTLRWTISNSPCTASTDDVVITFNRNPTTSAAGADQTSAATCGLTTVTLAANAPSVGTGAWSIISGTGGTVTTPTSATSTFTGTAGTTYTLRWTISNSPCTASTDDVVITFNRNPTTSAAGADQTSAATCGLTTVTLAANAPSIGTGAWSIISGTGGTVTTPTSATSTFSGTAGSTYTLRWTISNSPCTASTDDVVITFNQNPTTSAAGADQTSATTCGLTTVTLAANAPSIGTGAWSIISGTGGTVTTPTSATSTFTGTAGTTYTLRWTISNSPCTASTDDVVITFNQNPTTSAAGADQTGAATCGLTTVTLAANAPSIGTGAWSIISGAGGTVTTPTSATSTFTGTAGTTYTLRWTISNSPCTASTDDVVITFTPSPAATISYAGSPYYVSGGTATVTFAGTTGGTYSSTAGLSINATTGDVTLGTSTPGIYTVTYTIAAAGSCSVYTTTTSITVLSDLKTWDGGAGTNNWGDANNWNPNGVPTSAEDVDLTGAHTININVAATTKNLLLNNAGLLLTINAGNSLAVSGNFTLTDGTFNTADAFATVSGTVSVAGGTVGFTGSSSQTIPAYNYNNLTSSSTGSRTLAGSGTIGIAGTFTPGTNTYTITGSTINYNVGGTQTIAAFNYNNLTLSNSGTKTFASGTSGIASTLSITGSATANTSTNSSTISYNGSTNQTITALTYYGLNVSSTGGTVTGINTTVTNFSINSGTVDLNTNTLTTTGTATYTSGTINNGTVTSTGGTTTFAGTSFGAIVNATSNVLQLNGSTFNNTATLTKNGSTTATGVGGNIFNGVTILTNSGSGSFDLGNTNPETFNTHLTINNTGTSRIQIGISSAGNLFNGNTTINHGGNTASINTIIARNAGSTATFNGNLILNCTNLNASSGIIVSNEGTVVINGNVTVSTTSGRGVLFSDVGGSVTLASGFTISDAGAGSFTTGTLKLSRFSQTGATAQNTALTGTALLQIGPSSTFNGNVTFVSPQVLLNGCTYNGTASLTKNGATSNLGNGGNTFNGTTTLVNSGTAYFATGFTTADIFNADLTITNTGTGFMALADAATGTMFNGNVIMNSTNGTGGAGIYFGNGAGTAVTSTLASGKTISVGGTGFTAGRLFLRRFTQSGATAQSFTLTGTSILYLEQYSTFNGGVNFTSPQIYLNGCTYNGTASLTKNGATDNTSTGANIFNAATTLTNSGAGFLRLANTTADDFNSDATFIQTGSGLLQPAYANNNTFAGNLSTAGTATAISFGTGTGTVTLNGSGAQSITGSLTPTIRNLTIANTGNTVTSGVNSSVLENLSVTSGTFDLGNYTANRLTAGGTLTVSNGATLKIGSTNTIPSNYTTHSIGATSTIEYSGTNQSIVILNSSQNYGNLSVSGSGTKTNSGNLAVSNNVTVTAGALDISTYTLKIGGSISNSGTFTASSGTIEMNGTSAQTIPATAFAGKTIKNLTINNTSGVTLADTLKLTNDLTVSNGALTTGGFLVLKSSATATARVAQITSAAGTPISGNVIVERYVQGRRKYRLISSAVTTHANATLTAGQEAYSIWGNWQNSGINTTPNVGELITGGSSADGFDPGTPNASLYTYNDVSRVFTGYSTANGKNTKYTPLKAGVAYLMFVYGDRLNSVFATNPHNTVLIANGTLKTGDQTYNTGSAIPLSGVTGRFTLLGNPFASAIDWATVSKTNLADTYWGWDPNLSSTGGYITVTNLGGVTIQAPYSGSTGLNQYIQSGQGFFVKTTGASPSLIIREQDKVANFNANAFKGNLVANTIPLLAVNLQYVSSGTKVLADGVLTVFDPAFSNTAGVEDATKMANTAETISILNDTTLLSIDARKMPQNNDTLFLNVLRLTKPQYTLQIFAEEMAGTGVLAFLKDSYLNTTQPLSLSDTNNIVIDINTGIPASYNINRFKIIFQTSTVILPLKFISITAAQKNKDIKVDWAVAEETGVKKYEIERSADGINFSKAGEVAARGNNTSESYNWLDVHPLAGNNFYRIRAIDLDGKFLLSKIVMVKMGTANTAFKIFPNPVTNHKVNIHADEMAKGQYYVLLYNQQGQQIMQRTIDHTGGVLNQVITLDARLAGGIYHLQIAGGEIKYNLEIFIQ